MPPVTSRTVPAPPGGVYRVARDLNPFTLRRPRSKLATGAPELDGNRFDDPDGQYRTMYCATDAVAAFGETIARYRECEGLLERIDAFLDGPPDPDHDPPLQPGRVPRDYFASRYLGHATADPAARFADLEHLDTHAACAAPLLPLIGAYLRTRTIDRGTMHAADRRVTRTVSRHFHELAQTPDHADLRGLRYESRLHAGWECWVMWDPSPLRGRPAVEKVTRAHPALVEAARLLHVQL